MDSIKATTAARAQSIQWINLSYSDTDSSTIRFGRNVCNRFCREHDGIGSQSPSRDGRRGQLLSTSEDRDACRIMHLAQQATLR
jgi:hypothetical protein